MSSAEHLGHAEAAAMQANYKAAVEKWIAAIREEERLAVVDPAEAQVDRWEHAHFEEEKARNRAKEAKKNYEDAIRKSLFGF